MMAPPRGRLPGRRTAAVITVSDRCAAGAAEDRSGPVLERGLRALGFETSAPIVVPDEPKAIRSAVSRSARRSAVVALTGGTGLSLRDVTPDVVARLCDRLIPGFGEALRAAGARSTPRAWLSRSVAGQLGRCIIITLPGSVSGVRDGLSVLGELLPHAVATVDGAGH